MKARHDRNDSQGDLQTAKLLQGLCTEYTINPEARARLERYLMLVRHWNGVHNLTAHRSPQALILTHLAEAVWLSQYLLPEHVVIDVGAGAGALGIVAASVTPERAGSANSMRS